MYMYLFLRPAITEVRPGLFENLKEGDFIEELNLLSDKLEQENEAMLRILKTKKEEMHAAQLEAARVC